MVLLAISYIVDGVKIVTTFPENTLATCIKIPKVSILLIKGKFNSRNLTIGNSGKIARVFVRYWFMRVKNRKKELIASKYYNR